MSDSSPGTGFVDLRRSAAAIGHLAWVELRLFELLGGWVQVVPELDVKLAFAKQSYHHAWHAELLQDRLPTVPDADPGSLVQPANDGVRTLLDSIAGASTAETTIEKLVGVYRVLVPLKVAAYEGWLAASSPVADGPLRRAIGFVLLDESADLAEGEELLEARFVTDPGARTRADAWAAHLGAGTSGSDVTITG